MVVVGLAATVLIDDDLLLETQFSGGKAHFKFSLYDMGNAIRSCQKS